MKRFYNLLPLTSFVPTLNSLVLPPLLLLPIAISLALSPASFAQTTNRRTTPTRKTPGTRSQREPGAQPNTSTPTNSATTNSATNNSPATPANSAATTPITAPPATPIQVAIVNGQTLSTSDFDPAVRQELETVEQKIAEARRSVLDVQINTMLLEVEAKKRGIDTHRLYLTEVTNRIPTPTPAQIKKFVDDNRSQLQLDGMDQASINQQVTAYLHDEAENKLADDLVKRLRQSNPVVMGVDVNSPNLSDEAVLATVGGQPVKAAAVKERLKPIIYKIRSDAYLLAKQQADQLVDNMLLLDEAKKRQVGPEEIIRTEISDKVKTPTEAEVAKFYEENKARINGDLNTVRNQVALYLQNENRQRLERELSDKLRKNANVRWLITEPPQPVQNISVDDDPARGSVNAPVTIVEFTDFQCPACAAMHPVLEEVLKSYGDKVRFVVRDFPLNQHENARKAAEAADAANEQGKFFEYIAILFKNQKALDVASLKKYASDLGLNRVKFDAALDRGAYAAEVKHDVEDGEMYGVGSTPTIFINGVQLRTLSADGLREAIDRAAKSAVATAPK
jgi:protein-disulfide isomerase